MDGGGVSWGEMVEEAETTVYCKNVIVHCEIKEE